MDKPMKKGPDPHIPYWHSSRHGYRPEWIIIHDTEGSVAAALAWWQSDSNSGRSSAHYLISSTGKVISVVPERYAAHHAGGGSWPGIPAGGIGGTSFINLVSIGIELEYPRSPASPPWPEEQLMAAVKLTAEIAQRYQIPQRQILRHKDVCPKSRSDPRNFDWPRFLAEVGDARRALEDKEEAVRQAAWKAQGISLNLRSALLEYAREYNLGAPLTAELDLEGYRFQGFSGGIVYQWEGAGPRHMRW